MAASTTMKAPLHRMARTLTSLCSCFTSGCCGSGGGGPKSGWTSVPAWSAGWLPGLASFVAMTQCLLQARVAQGQQGPLPELPDEQPHPGAADGGHGPEVEQPEEV